MGKLSNAKRCFFVGLVIVTMDAKISIFLIFITSIILVYGTGIENVKVGPGNFSAAYVQHKWKMPKDAAGKYLKNAEQKSIQLLIPSICATVVCRLHKIRL